MKLKKGSIIFLSILFVILIFIVGVRYGQRVERTNKIIDYFISLPPSPTREPTQKPLEFREYAHNGCGIKFLYPSFLLKDKESSTSGTLRDGKTNNVQLSFNCNQGLKAMPPHPRIPTISITFKNKKIGAYLTDDQNNYDFVLLNPRSGRNISIQINKSLYPLFEKSLEFLP